MPPSSSWPQTEGGSSCWKPPAPAQPLFTRGPFKDSQWTKAKQMHMGEAFATLDSSLFLLLPRSRLANMTAQLKGESKHGKYDFDWQG